MPLTPQLSLYDKATLSWIKEACQEGQLLIKDEQANKFYEDSKRLLFGRTAPVLQGRSGISINLLKRIFLDTISAMSDIRPIWNFSTENKQWEKAAQILSKLTRAWWRNSHSDLRLQDALAYALIGGSGYLATIYNPERDELELVPFGPRDVLPIRPRYTNNVQDWQGAIMRQRLSVNELVAHFPEKSDQIRSNKESWFPDETTDSPKLLSNLELLASASVPQKVSPVRTEGYVDFLRVYIKDPAINTGAYPKEMGTPGSSWSYTVLPVGYPNPITGRSTTEEEAKLYPRGRFIACTTDCILYDGPNPYWHGEIPLVQVSLDPVPWSLLGLPMIADLASAQEELTRGLRGIGNGMRQWFRRGLLADKRALPKSVAQRIDTEAPGFQILVNSVAGTAAQVVDGPQFPSWMFDYLRYVVEQMQDVSGVSGLRQLAQLKQLPSADSLQQMLDSLSPVLRKRANVMELQLTRLANQVKSGFFQFYDRQRRVQILGEDGTVLEDFDFDPGNMVPAMESSQENYEPGLDARLPRQDRAREFQKKFFFSVAPNSFLNVSHAQTRLFNLRLGQMGLLDPYSIWHSFDVPNVGKWPAETVPERIIYAKRQGLMPGDTPEVAQAKQLAAVMAAMGAVAAGAAPGGPGGPPPQHLSGSGPQGGRPPSNEKPPQMTAKMDAEGPRPVVTTS